MDGIKSFGGNVHYPVSLTHPSTVNFEGGSGLYGVQLAEMRESVNDYLKDAAFSTVMSLAEIIPFNKDNPDLQAGIDQQYLITAQESTKTVEWLKKARTSNEKLASTDGVLRTMAEHGEHGLDFIVSPTDGPICSIAALAGCPTANVPLGYLEPSGRPFGLTFVAKAGEETKLLEVMNAYEATFPKRRLPQVLCETPKEYLSPKLIKF